MFWGLISMDIIDAQDFAFQREQIGWLSVRQWSQALHSPSQICHCVLYRSLFVVHTKEPYVLEIVAHCI